LQAIKEKRLNTEKIFQEEKEENIKLKATIEKLIRIREENAKLKQQIANMEYEQKKPHDKTNRPSKPNFHNKLYRLISVDEPTIVKRTRNLLSDSSSSETVQPKTKKETP
jgi:hypothetical protein